VSAAPRLSVVLVTRDALAELRPTLAALRAQTIAGDIELLVVAPTAAALDEAQPGWLDGFHSVQAVPVGPIAEVDAASAHALLRARAPVVASVEDHAFPEPDWGERILAAFESGPWSVVGGRMVNANPGGLSWANVLVSHVSEVTRPEGEVTVPISTHNASFDTEILAGYGERLLALMGRDGGLMRSLLDDGHRIYVAPGARYRHLQVTRWASLVRYRIDAGRNAAATRARQGGWSRAARLAHAAAGPLIPLVLIVRRAGSARSLRLPPRTLVPLAIVAALEGAGEVLGYALGPGGSKSRLAEVETHRRRLLSSRDRAHYDMVIDHPAA
jgi:hypothetical protein